jgi:hypothetical protein
MGLSWDGFYKKCGYTKTYKMFHGGGRESGMPRDIRFPNPFRAGDLPSRKRFRRIALAIFLSLTAWSGNAGR